MRAAHLRVVSSTVAGRTEATRTRAISEMRLRVSEESPAEQSDDERRRAIDFGGAPIFTDADECRRWVAERRALFDACRQVRQQPDNAYARLARARAELGLRELDAAMESASSAVHHKPDLGEAYVVRARARLGLGDAAGAALDCGRALRI